MKFKIGNSVTYIKRWGFSINEGCYPNIHISWSPKFFFYVCLCNKFRWWYTKGIWHNESE